MSTLNYIDENRIIHKAGIIPKNYPSTNIGYNNSQSGLSADNVQEAIDEVADSVTEQLSNKKPLQEAVTDPTADGYSVSFINSITQNINGVISATKKNIVFRDYISHHSQKSFNIGNSKNYMLIAIGYTGCVVIGRTISDGSHNIYSVYNDSVHPVTVGTGTKGVITVLNPTDGGMYVYIMYLP